MLWSLLVSQHRHPVTHSLADNVCWSRLGLSLTPMWFLYTFYRNHPLHFFSLCPIILWVYGMLSLKSSATYNTLFSTTFVNPHCSHRSSGLGATTPNVLELVPKGVGCREGVCPPYWGNSLGMGRYSGRLTPGFWKLGPRIWPSNNGQ